MIAIISRQVSFCCPELASHQTDSAIHPHANYVKQNVKANWHVCEDIATTTTLSEPSSSPVATMLSVTSNKEKTALLYNRKTTCRRDTETDLCMFGQTGVPQKGGPCCGAPTSHRMLNTSTTLSGLWEPHAHIVQHDILWLLLYKLASEFRKPYLEWGNSNKTVYSCNAEFVPSFYAR